ncbi:hypothetical protein [Kitasatospora indigofera]|uniref:hypothetical protein n=1 Tax=Kitasatospora indigofera TaxID=67307 RepID=UPI00367AD7D2
MWRGFLSPRRVLDLVEHGPDDSAFAASLRGGPAHRGWTVQTHLIASVVDGINNTTWAIAQTNSQRRLRPPRPLQRPAARQHRPRTTIASLRRLAAPELPPGG